MEDKLAEFEEYVKAYPFNVLRYILKNKLEVKLMVKSTSDIRKHPTYEEVLGFDNKYSNLGKMVQTSRLGWVYFNTCTFKLIKI